MAQVICEVSHGLRDSERTVAVRDVFGRRQFLRVEHDFLSWVDGVPYLPIGVVGVDEKKKMALIELPHAADSGAHRLWVWFADMDQFAEALP